MFLWPVFQFIKDNKWAQIALITLAAIATLGIYLAMRDDGVRKRERARFEVERMRQKALVAEARRKINQENENASQASDDAVRSLPPYRHTDELRARDPRLGTIVLGDGEGRSGGTETR